MNKFSRARKALTLLSGAAIAAGGLTVAPVGIAVAAPSETVVLPSENAYGFTDPSGSKWKVPPGVTRVVVALQGGTGGRGVDFSDTPSSWLGYGTGDDFLIDAKVSPGDVLTIYAGRHASGKKDGRDGGAGFISRGTGGKGSLDGKHAGGGGGAAALKINGELIAVAGGGGGGGGGWPSSGTGGGAGKGFMSSNAGGGGGAGKSWVKNDRRYALKHGRTNFELGLWRPGADLTAENPSGIINPVICQIHRGGHRTECTAQ